MSEYFRKYIKKEHYPVHPSQIKYKTTFKNCILEAMKRRQWRESDGDDWDINWTEKEWVVDIMDQQHISISQRVNHYRNHYELTRKDLMIKNIKKHKKSLEKEAKNEDALSYNFTPLTYQLPSEYTIFCEEFKKVNQISEQKQLWIMKPVGKSQGKGIFIFRNIKDIASWKNQYRYNPENPSPLTVYLYRTGFARFTHHRYDLEDINNVYVHLTNVAIQKNSENYDEKLGGKWLLQTLKLFMIQKFGQEKVSEAFFQVQNIIIKALLAVQKVIINDKRCFELYGFDVLFDANLKPWLLEINSSPSMTANTQIDSELKLSILDDTFTIIDMEKVLNGQEEQIGGFDLIYKGIPIKLPSNSTYSSLLGCSNNRNQQLKKLAKTTAIRLGQQFIESQQQQQQYQQKLQEVNNKQKMLNQKGIQYQNNNQNQGNKFMSKQGYQRQNTIKQQQTKIIKKKKTNNQPQSNNSIQSKNNQNSQNLNNQQNSNVQKRLPQSQQQINIQNSNTQKQINIQQQINNNNQNMLKPLNEQNKFQRYFREEEKYSQQIKLQKQFKLHAEE
ncbi:tubulin-tyrosine ligase family protein, putative [Ichthyophthirius multifiliis]|uniref:Tubulin--tyrosine ligase-like protein 9 n=1 Tax=Ichthyophthirius multifiliis TaxID=5932 RepID=G0QWT4_ICHMU|nr:tubulin-tyrosine ligase family protein, putative [Ichthyophthirius multifiliis]EGR30323.1 tubulin-tyrosine ligase family protein, putative [Ichthyophthirius multifiliis]|eukprot:XP_004031910.1 tubulin-tyrosine ligase family protein, putative [Ichthyophthirius multifiliis]